MADDVQNNALFELRQRRACRRDFSRMGWALVALMAVPALLLYGVDSLLYALAPWALGLDWLNWVVSVACQYLVGFPAAMLVLGRAEHRRSPEERPLRPLKWVQALCISMAILYITNIATLALLSLIGSLRGAPVVNPITAAGDDYPQLLTFLSTCVFAPVYEELFFRRLLLDRLRPYGARFAAVASALCFGLVHGNLSQMFYAFALGLFFAWVALRSGRVWQTVLLHACVNFIGGGFFAYLLGEAGVPVMGLLFFLFLLFGGGLLRYYRRAFRLPKGEPGLAGGKQWRLFLLNPGMLLFFLSVGVTTALFLAL